MDNRRWSLRIERENPHDKRVRELEDIICTLKFELNGLKNVVASVESEGRTEREMMNQGFQQRVKHVEDWLDLVNGEVDKKALQLTQLEEKIRTYEGKSTAHATKQDKERNIYDKGVPLEKQTNRMSCSQCASNQTELGKHKEKIQTLEKQLQVEKEKREKAEQDYAEVVEKYKDFKFRKDKKPLANLGVPHKLILPEAPAPKFWLQAIQPSGNTDILSLNDILDGILRPFRDDEIWALLYQVAKLLHTKHETGKIHGNLSLDTIRSNQDGKISIIDVGAIAAPKFKPSNAGMDAIYDIFGLGVVLWSTSDYLLDDDEEPATSEALCILIGDMTSDEISEVPSIDELIAKSATHAQVAQKLFREIIRELDRKKEMRNQYEKGITINQGDLVQSLMHEIATGINLKKVPPPEAKPLHNWKVDNSWQTNNGKMKLIRVA